MNLLEQLIENNVKTENVFYNQDSIEKYEDAKIFFGKPNGIRNHNKTPHKFATKIMETKMDSNTWFISECNLPEDRVLYEKLSQEDQYVYVLTLAQLSTNDAVQTSQLADGLTQYITSPVVVDALVYQAREEALHSRTYADMAKEVIRDDELVFNLHKEDKYLKAKNVAVANMYKMVSGPNVKNPNLKELQLALVANQILEQIIFPFGFLTLWNFEMPGTNKAIAFIERDESQSHVALISNIFRASVKENGLSAEVINLALEMIKYMSEIEKEWAYYISDKKDGFSKKAIDIFVEQLANRVCSNLNLPLIYEKTDGGPLKKKYEKFRMVRDDVNTITRTAFFEKQVGDYNIGSIDDDY